MHCIWEITEMPSQDKLFPCPRSFSPAQLQMRSGRRSGRTLWKMSWTFLKQQTKSAEESRSTFNNLLCKDDRDGATRCTTADGKITAGKYSLFHASMNYVFEWLILKSHWKEMGVLLYQSQTSADHDLVSRSRPKLPFCCFLFPGVEESIIITTLPTHFLSEMLEGRHSKLQIHRTRCKSVLTYKPDPSSHPASQCPSRGREWATKPSPLLTAWTWQWLFPSSRFTTTKISFGVRSHGWQKEMNLKKPSEVMRWESNKCKDSDAASGWESTYITDWQVLGVHRRLWYISVFLYTFSPKYLLAK